MAALRDAIALLPRGVAWPKSPDSRLGRLLDALTRELDRVEARAADLLRESNPATTTELLREWDALVALNYPGALAGGFDRDLARAMIAWLLGTSTLSRESIERFCALSEIPFAADGDGVTRPLYRLLSVDHTNTHEATIRLLSTGSNSIVEALFRRKAHATGTLVFDWVVPAIAITSPADASIACDELVTVTGTSTGVGTVQVVVTESGGLVTTYTTTADSGTGEWSVQILLATYLDGEDATIVARGYTGIVTADSGWVESTPVVVTSEFIVDVYFTGPLTTTESYPTLSGSATPGSTIVVEVAGDTEDPVVADVNGDWSVELSNTGLDLGTNEITIHVTGPGPCEHEDSIVVDVERVQAPANVIAPVVSGTPTEAETLTTTTGSWTGTTPISFTFQWRRDGSPISGATTTTYVLQAADVGALVDCVVTATNVAGSTAQDSNDLGPIASSGGGVAPTITVAPVLTWTVAHGSSPTITEGTYTGDAGTWTYDLVRLPSTTVLSGVSKATVEAYVADRATDLGPDWKVTGTITNGSGSDAADSNLVTWDRSALPLAGCHSGEGLTLADAGTTVDAYASSYGAFSCTRTAPTASQRPAYNPTGGVGGRPLITFDGVNDMLVGTITKGSAWSSYEIGFVGERQSFTAANEGIVGYGSGGSPRFYLNDNTSTTHRFTVVGGANVTGGNPGTTAHYSGDAASGGTVNTRTGGTVINTTSTTVTSRSDGESWVIGSRTPAGANYSHYEFQADYIGELLTADQRLDLRALLTYLTGVSS